MRKKVMLVMILSSLRTDEKSTGGVDSVCQILLQGLTMHSRDIEYFVLAFNPDSNPTFVPRLIALSENIRLKWVSSGLPAYGLGKLIPDFLYQNNVIQRELRKFKPDTLHVHLYSWLLNRYRNVRTILTLHSYQKIARKSQGFLNNFLHERVLPEISLRRADVVTSVSVEIVQKLGTERNPIYIGNPVNDVFFSVRRKQGPSKGFPRIVMTGNVEPRKRVMDGVKIVERLKETHKNVRLCVAGRIDRQSPYARSLKKYIERQNLTPNVEMLGPLSIEELRRLYAEADAGLFLSDSETFGLAPLEMIAAQVPLVTTNTGVIKWDHSDFKRRGLRIIQPGDVEGAISNCLEILKQDTPREQALADFVMDRYSVKRAVLDYVRLYEAGIGTNQE